MARLLFSDRQSIFPPDLRVWSIEGTNTRRLAKLINNLPSLYAVPDWPFSPQMALTAVAASHISYQEAVSLAPAEANVMVHLLSSDRKLTGTSTSTSSSSLLPNILWGCRAAGILDVIEKQESVNEGLGAPLHLVCGSYDIIRNPKVLPAP